MKTEVSYQPKRIPYMEAPIQVNLNGGIGMERLSPYDAGLGAIVDNPQIKKLNSQRTRR